MNAARAILALALLAAACGDKATVTLRYQPATGSSFHYVMNQDVTMKAEGDAEQQLAITIAFTQTVNGPAGGGLDVTLRVDSVQLSAPGAGNQAGAQASQMLRGLESHIVFDDRMQVLSSQISNAAGVPPQMASQIAAGLRGASFPLPDHPLAVGESWTVEMTAPTAVPGLNRPLTLKYRITLKDLSTSGADSVAHFAVQTSFPKDPIEIDLGGQKATMTIDGSLKGDQRYSIVRDAIVSVDLQGTVRVGMRGGPMPEGTMVMDQRLRLTLLEGAATP
jgi:hypothetical protein